MENSYGEGGWKRTFLSSRISMNTDKALWKHMTCSNGHPTTLTYHWAIMKNHIQNASKGNFLLIYFLYISFLVVKRYMFLLSVELVKKITSGFRERAVLCHSFWKELWAKIRVSQAASENKRSYKGVHSIWRFISVLNWVSSSNSNTTGNREAVYTAGHRGWLQEIKRKIFSKGDSKGTMCQRSEEKVQEKSAQERINSVNSKTAHDKLKLCKGNHLWEKE